MAKSPDAFRTISEVAEWLDRPAHVLRFWESKFTQVKPVKRAGGRRYYRRQDMLLLGGIKNLLHDEGMTIKGVQKLLRENGVKHVTALSQPLDGEEADLVDVTAEAAMDVPQDQPADNLLSFPDPAMKPAASDPPVDATPAADPEGAPAKTPAPKSVPAKKKPAFEREPEQANLFEMADSVAPELDDRYIMSDEDMNAQTVDDDPEDVPLPLGDPAADLPAETDHLEHAAEPAQVSPVDVPDDILISPFPGHLTALLDPATEITAQNHDDALALRNRLAAHLKALKSTE